MVPYLASLTKYGEMTTLHMGAKTWVVLNDDKAISDIINKHGKITNERPEMPIAGGLVSQNLRTVIRQTAPWTEGRRVMQHLFNSTTLRTYGNWQDIESSLLLSSLLQNPEKWYSHIYRYSTSVYYRMIMGERLSKTTSELNEFQRIAIEFIWSVYRSAIDFFPKLDKLPRILQPWRPFWEKMGREHHKVSEGWWKSIESSVENGTAKSSFVRDTLLHPDVKYRGNKEEAMYLATSIIAAGADNTRMTLNVFMMAMISHSQILSQARAEIDQVCATGSVFRLPGVSDIGSLPYMSAIVKEVLRWRPTVPISPPHELTEDLEYEGFRFPKGTNFVINVIAASRDVENADAFCPERWLDGNEDNVVHNLWVFGGGRRICVGYKVAQQALFVAMARLIFCFDIFSNEPVDTRNLNHLTLAEPFPVKVQVRNSRYADLIMKAAAADEL
ncbi:MAG: hypothetical protein M1821_006587 [Bathelium mastoideum]|nr:MAG: hypothetical protein M1821_006587 [Bathelium mastoideum]